MEKFREVLRMLGGHSPPKYFFYGRISTGDLPNVTSG
jgi:hypothetical protein